VQFNHRWLFTYIPQADVPVLATSMAYSNINKINYPKLIEFWTGISADQSSVALLGSDQQLTDQARLANGQLSGSSGRQVDKDFKSGYSESIFKLVNAHSDSNDKLCQFIR